MEAKQQQKVTIYDIAEEAGVSSATVSRAISGKGYVSAEKKELIKQLVKKYGFRPNTFAQSLKNGFTKTIGFIVPHIGNMYFANVYYEFEKIASAHGYLTMLLNSNGDYETESKLFQSLLLKNVDGIVMMGGRVDAVQVDDECIGELQDLGGTLPVVLCGSHAARYGCPGVYTDDRRSVRLLLEHLKGQDCGNVCFIGGSDKFYPSFEKKEYIYEYGAKLGLNVDVRWTSEGNMFNYEAGYDGMKKLLNQGVRPDAVCGANDYVASGAMHAALVAGYRVPEDIVFAGFDDVETCRLQIPPLTSVNPKYENFGKKIFRILERQMKGEENDREGVTLVRTEIAVRGSSLRRNTEAG